MATMRRGSSKNCALNLMSRFDISRMGIDKQACLVSAWEISIQVTFLLQF